MTLQEFKKQENVFICAEHTTKHLLLHEQKPEHYLYEIVKYLQDREKRTKNKFEFIKAMCNNYSGYMNIHYSTELFFLNSIYEALHYLKIKYVSLEHLFVQSINENLVKVEITIKLVKSL